MKERIPACRCENTSLVREGDGEQGARDVASFFDDRRAEPAFSKWERDCLACGRRSVPGYSCQLVFVTRVPLRSHAHDANTVSILERGFEYINPLFVKPYLCISCLRQLRLRNFRLIFVLASLLSLVALFFLATTSTIYSFLKVFSQATVVALAIPMGVYGWREIEELRTCALGGPPFADLVARIAQVHPQDPWDHWLIKNLHKKAKKIQKHHGCTDCFVARTWRQNVEVNRANARKSL